MGAYAYLIESMVEINDNYDIFEIECINRMIC